MLPRSSRGDLGVNKDSTAFELIECEATHSGEEINKETEGADSVEVSGDLELLNQKEQLLEELLDCG